MRSHRNFRKTTVENDRDQSIGQDGEEYEMDSVATALQVHLVHGCGVICCCWW